MFLDFFFFFFFNYNKRYLLNFITKIFCWYALEAPRRGGTYEYHTTYVFMEKYKKKIYVFNLIRF